MAETNDEGYEPLDNGELEDAKGTLKKLFLEVNSVDKINKLKSCTKEEKEKILKVLKPLVEWVSGKIPSLFGNKDYFYRQNDSELTSKVALLLNALHDGTNLQIKLGADEFINFICNNDNSDEKEPYTKETVKYCFIYFVRKYLEESSVDVKSIDDSLLLGSVRNLFKNLKYYDLLIFDDNNKDVREVATKEFQDKFEKKELRDAVFNAVERFLKERVKGYNTLKYNNRDGKEESLKDRVEFVKQRLKI